MTDASNQLVGDETAIYESLDAQHLRILSRTDWVEQVVLYLKKKAMDSGVCDENQANRLVVAMTEAITNAIVHGNYGLSSKLKENGGEQFRQAISERQADPDYVHKLVDVRVDRDEKRCMWTITDDGAGFNVEAMLKRLDSEDPQVILSSGRGISIMRAFVDAVEWAEDGRQIRLTVYSQKTDERRGAQRRKYTANVAVDREGDPRIFAMARDLSATGIAFITVQPIPEEANVTVHLDYGLETQRPAPGKIVRCRHLSGPYYDVAVHFDSAGEPAAPSAAVKPRNFVV